MKKFVESLISLTGVNKLIWHSFDVEQKEGADLAYLSPWMICLQNERNSLILQVAKSYHNWTELSGREYDLGSLSLAIASQHSRAERGLLVKPALDPQKLKKFQRDKMQKEEWEERLRSRIINECGRVMNILNNQTAV